MKSRRITELLVAVLIVLVAAMVLTPAAKRAMRNALKTSADHSPPPAMFEERLTFDQAMARGEAEGKPVFAVFSASWCPPCGTYKRGALSDARVAAAIRGRMIPVYVDVDQQRAAPSRFNVRSIPTTMVLKGDERVRGAIGALSADELLRLIDESLRE